MRGRWFVIAAVTLVTLGCSDFFLWSSEDRDLILRGTVTDGATDQPLEGVSVSLEWVPPDTASSPAAKHIDTFTAEDGTYRIETKLGNVSCHTMFLFFGKGGYEATRITPDCKGGKQVFNVELDPED